MTEVAFAFKDPVKAIYERTIGTNPFILQAFVNGIIINDKNRKIKGTLKTIIPKHISNIASIRCLDTLNFIEISNLIALEQKILIADQTI